MRLVALLVTLALCGFPGANGPPAPTAGAAADLGTLDFEILGPEGDRMPGRLTFTGTDGQPAAVFRDFAADPADLALRESMVYSLSGANRITVPAGDYEVYVSRGLEWSVHHESVTLVPGGTYRLVARLRHEVNTDGWVSGDFHLHTLTHSGHGDANLPERMISLIGEQVELAVATDHNHHTDYNPTLQALGAGAHVTAVVGNEVSVPIGHFNAFPLDPARPVADPGARDAHVLFTFLHAEPNAAGIVPVVQVNHPRWDGIDYFTRGELDPVTGVAAAALFSLDFDAIEILNENAAWGYLDAEIETEHPIGGQRYWALGDWFQLLNRGHHAAATGNSDSHAVANVLAGYPRNYVRCDSPDAGAIDVAEFVARLRARQAFTTTGPFVTFTAGEVSVGGHAVTDEDGRIDLSIRVQVASWIDCDRIHVIVNGNRAATLDVADSRAPERFVGRHTLRVKQDSWVLLLVEGDDAMDPVVPLQGRPVRPLAVTNPITISLARGALPPEDAGWTPPAETARQRAASPGAAREYFAEAGGMERALLLGELVAQSTGDRRELLQRGLSDPDRAVQLAAARAIERDARELFVPALEDALQRATNDAYRAVALYRALRACRGTSTEDDLTALLRQGEEVLRRHAAELQGKIPARPVDVWSVLGYFPGGEAPLDRDFGPERNQEPAGGFAGKAGTRLAWQPRNASDAGYVDLLGLDPDGIDRSREAVAYARTWIHSDQPRTVRFALGSDDGCRLYQDQVLVLEDRERHTASPWRHVGELSLDAGWTRLLLKVENRDGAFGCYFQLVGADAGLRFAANPPARVPQNAWGLLSEGKYLAALAAAEQDFSNSRSDLAQQELATMRSMVGDEAGALEVLPASGPASVRVPAASPLDLAAPHGALETIVALARDRQIVILNEAHHVPMHRAFSLEVVRALLPLGFEYFALETLSPEIDALPLRGFPLRGDGAYIPEPVFGDLLRQALRLGYRPIAYEMTSHHRLADPIDSINAREAEQCEHLVERIFARDPDARVVIHVGYAHAAEDVRTLADGREQAWMAARLARATGIDPLTIDQTAQCAQVPLARSSAEWQYAHAKGWLDQPTVFRMPDGSFFAGSGYQGRVDLQVFHPDHEPVDGRPGWLACGGYRQPVEIPVELEPDEGRVLVQAFLREEPDEAVPMDQVVLYARDVAPVLMLPEGEYRLVVQDESGQELARQDLEP